jgi:Hint module
MSSPSMSMMPVVDTPVLKLTTPADSTTKKVCFAGSETVMRSSGEVVAISQVKVGDQVLAADAAGKIFYSEVVFLPHGTNNEKADFTHISTVVGSSIKMTPSHIIPAGSCGSSASLPLVYASNVRVGDCIMTVSGEETVSAVEAVQGEGLYTIVTKAEYLVVNGIIASPFGANHMMANMYYNIHRFLYTATPECLKWSWLLSANEVSADCSDHVQHCWTLLMMIPLFCHTNCTSSTFLFIVSLSHSLLLFFSVSSLFKC